MAVYISEQSAPGTPSSGNVVVYAKTDGFVYAKDDAGTEILLSVASLSTAKAWGEWAADAVLDASFNADALTDGGVGDYTFNFTTNFAGTEYSYALGLQMSVDNAAYYTVLRSPAVGSARILVMNAAGSLTETSVNGISAIFFGAQ